VKEIEKLRELIEKSRVISFLGGAGVSTESGLGDFRNEAIMEAVRQKYGYPPETILRSDFFREEPEIFFAYYREYFLKEAEPNAAHYALARLEKRRKLNAIVTQNVDELHFKAGSRKVYSLHGNIAYNRCMHCAALYDADFMRKTEGIPRCSRCGGIIKPEVVLYGEPLDEYVFRNARAALFSAELLIVGGTSLQVYPAAGLLEFFGGKHLVILNESPTPFDKDAELLIRGKIGTILSNAIN